MGRQIALTKPKVADEGREVAACDRDGLCIQARVHVDAYVYDYARVHQCPAAQGHAHPGTMGYNARCAWPPATTP